MSDGSDARRDSRRPDSTGSVHGDRPDGGQLADLAAAGDVEPERPDYAVVRRLVLGSALMLFLELALIRWLGSNVVHLSYFSNFVLLGSFLGHRPGLPDLPEALVGAAGDARSSWPCW